MRIHTAIAAIGPPESVNVVTRLTMDLRGWRLFSEMRCRWREGMEITAREKDVRRNE